ncbi:toll/interleukin-1 receptor domain-containing protein [Roseimaritima ulvae]|uniref:TIR domain-containing protein n=1 Tax=Roseimaritima ulvae TaxID=980254 RepID=A0A5B9QN69_9BACT|nr:toll/interleukin-1 receptor domain-containing protein [Roseimaritima ulvae]QEG40448.1 hypothetical protein UC8_24600 [Roseimaritima ulvae]
MTHIFVSYRRVDSATIVGRVIDRLDASFGNENIFRDLDSIDYGQEFGEVINQALEHCEVVLVIIGDDWLKVVDESGQRRLDNSEDWVRLEVSNALRHRLHVIPVLVENASMPSASCLPEDLKPLAKRNAARVREDPDFGGDIDRLCTAIRKKLSATSSNTRKPLVKTVMIVVALVAVSTLGLFAASQFFAEASKSQAENGMREAPTVESSPESENRSVLGKWEQKFVEQDSWNSGGIYEFYTDSLGALQLRAVSPPSVTVQAAAGFHNVEMDGSKFKTDGEVLTFNADWGRYGIGLFRLERKNANLFTGVAYEEDGTEYRKNEFHRVIE